MNRLRFKIWVEGENGVFLGNGRVKLLEAIEHTGSISAAAKHIGLSYKKAWEQVNDMNRNSEQALLKRVSGGKGGGGTQLTVAGKEWIRRFNKLKEEIAGFVQNEEKQHQIK